jgi:hypothetical protein
MKQPFNGTTAAPLAAIIMLSVVALSAGPKFTSVWKAPAAREVSFAGKKVAALVMTDDDSLRVSGEEALVRELNSRGLQGVASYRIVPKPELKDPDKARGWYERYVIDGVVAMRPVNSEKRTTYTPGTWVSPYYGTFWGWYGYGWGGVYVPGEVNRDTVVTVETLIFSVPRNALLWAAVSETKNPKTLGQFVEDLVKESVKELHKQGLAKNVKQ